MITGACFGANALVWVTSNQIEKSSWISVTSLRN